MRLVDRAIAQKPVAPPIRMAFPWSEAARRAVPLLVAKAANFAMSLACFALVARFLGPERFGVYVLAYSVPWLLLPAVDFGFSAVVAREIAATKALGWARTAVRMSLFTVPGIVSVLLLGSWVMGLRGSDFLLIAVGALQLAAFVLRPAEGVLVAEKRTLELAMTTLVANVVSLAGVVWATAARSHEALILVAHAGYAIVYAALTAILARSALKPGGEPPVSALWREAWPFGLGGLAASVAERAGVPIVVLVSGREAGGLYGAAFRLYELAVAAAGTGLLVVRPYLAEASPNPEALLGRGEDLLRGAIALSGMVALWVAGAARELVTWIYGPGYRAADVALLGLAPALANVLPGNAAAELGIASRSRMPYLQAASTAAALSVVGAVLFSRWIGLVGPGIALALAGTFAILWIAHQVNRAQLMMLYLRAVLVWVVLFGFVRVSSGLPGWTRFGVGLATGITFALWLSGGRR